MIRASKTTLRLSGAGEQAGSRQSRASRAITSRLRLASWKSGPPERFVMSHSDSSRPGSFA